MLKASSVFLSLEVESRHICKMQDSDYITDLNGYVSKLLAEGILYSFNCSEYIYHLSWISRNYKKKKLMDFFLSFNIQLYE